jgi:predicted HicB family RNase H-like nuclease
MSSLNISIPDSVRERIESLAREDGVSLDAFVASVLSQRVAVAEADLYIRRRAVRGSAE